MSLKYGGHFTPEEVAALAALVRDETAEMCAENQWREHQGESPAYAADCWNNPLAERLRIVLEQRNLIED